ncbi:MAG: hypothetical protein ACI9SQ_001624 [Rubritalea sp.]|jgi:hypothetical protein
MMEQQVNPYEVGQVHQQAYVDSSLSITVTPVALGALMGTKFWVSLVGVVMLIMGAITVLSLLFASSQFVGGFLVELIMPLIMFVINVILAVRLVQYGQAIGRLKAGGTNHDFERAMEVQSKFWKLLGVVYIMIVVLMIVLWLSAT